MSKNSLSLPELKKKFAFYVDSLSNLTPQDFVELTSFIIELGDKIREMGEDIDKSEKDYEQMELLRQELQNFIQSLSDAQVVLRKKEWRETEEYYLKLKREAETGGPTAEQVLKDFEPVYFEMQKKMEDDENAAPALEGSFSFLESLIKS